MLGGTHHRTVGQQQTGVLGCGNDAVQAIVFPKLVGQGRRKREANGQCQEQLPDGFDVPCQFLGWSLRDSRILRLV